MKAKLLKMVRKKVSLQERNGKYYVYYKGEICYSDGTLEMCKSIYRYNIISLATQIFKPKCKHKLL